MSFVDKVQINLVAGNGGNGVMSFHREKFVQRGGPNGGDGGDGGSIVLLASSNQNTLANFRYKKELKAENGMSGEKSRRHGRSGQDLVVKVPLGTAVLNQDGEVLADLTTEAQTVVIAKGGLGGYGNAHFVSSTRQAPKFAEKGEPGEVKEVTFELKLIAEVGLIGLPNAGKSTLLSVLSNAQPEIADYPFTTLSPNLGVVDLGDQTSLLFADIPGLIEGAAKGKGLGDDFLRHVERTLVLVHLIDAYNDSVVKDYQTIQNELKLYRVDLTSRPQVVVINKIDGLSKQQVNKLTDQLKEVVSESPIVAISAKAKTNLKPLLKLIDEKVRAERQAYAAAVDEQTDEVPVIRLEQEDSSWTVTSKDNSYLIKGTKIEKFAARTDFSNTHSVQRLRDIMKRSGIMHELHRRGITNGQMIIIGDRGQFPY